MIDIVMISIVIVIVMAVVIVIRILTKIISVVDQLSGDHRRDWLESAVLLL